MVCTFIHKNVQTSYAIWTSGQIAEAGAITDPDAGPAFKVVAAGGLEPVTPDSGSQVSQAHVYK